jgi:hypothetical protein
MPRFITNGPDIPERLLWAHEEGRVVFFCGAGISYLAGLPSFKGLVDQIYAQLGARPSDVEEQAYLKNQYDTTLDLLERRIPGQRVAVRMALSSVLKPKLRRKGSTITHRSLLQLASDRKGRVRLVTTNFDRVFSHLLARHSPVLPIFSAPLLPIPKPTRWHGVVHLHGLLPDPPDEIGLNRLVLTSGDFGLAYLTERWAARFVSELFRYYTVCFVGYSINDPVLRYMMDALAVDEMLGEPRQEAYAFGGFEDGTQRQTMLGWEVKGVTPLLYEVRRGNQDHSALHQTLKEWADTYRDGVRGKEMIIAQHGTTPPLASSRLDYGAGRVLWALTDGLAAKHFAEMDPVPPLEWLESLAQDQFGHEDLPRFGVTANRDSDENLAFSFIRRPSPYTLAPQMTLADLGASATRWDEVMFQLSRWMTRHLDDPNLLLWLVKQGGHLNYNSARQIQQRLIDIDRITHNDHGEIDRIRATAPKAIPSPRMRVLWRLILSRRLESRTHHHDLYDWLRRFKQDGLTPTLRMELRESLTPRVSLREPFRLKGEPNESHGSKGIKDLVEWEIVLSARHIHSILRDISRLQNWSVALTNLLQDFSLLLRDALDLMHELEGADEKSDHSYIHQPSISHHPQNNDFRDWTALIILTRDAWVATAQYNPTQAKLAAEGWRQTPYPLFKRLAFFAASQGNLISADKALDWLLCDDHWWLWSSETERESMRLLVAIAPRLDVASLASLLEAILSGPPRQMFRDDIDSERWKRLVDHEVWLRLKRAQGAGVALGQTAMDRLSELTQEYPKLKLATDESDEFPYWMGEVEGIDRESVVIPTPRRKVVAWLKQHPSSDFRHDDGWRQRCRDDFRTTACALFELTREEQWPIDRWQEALQAWAEDTLRERSWRYMARVIARAPENVIHKLEHPLSWWLEVQAHSLVGQEGLFIQLVRQLLNLKSQGEIGADDHPVSTAVNHPVGHVTEALLRWWYRQEPKEAQGLSTTIKPLFTEICQTRVQMYRHGRVLLAKHAIALFRVDEEWAKTFLLPLFEWRVNKLEARAAWEGFLWSPRLYLPLLSAIKQPMLETATYYAQLGEHAERFADLLTFLALNPGEAFTKEELAHATSTLPREGLENAAQTLVRALEGAGEQRDEYWRNRVLPYFKSVWPKFREVISPAISANLARLCIAAREAFPEAFDLLQHWLKPVNHPDYLVSQLVEDALCKRFPGDALSFLNLIIGDDAQWLTDEVRTCLNDIKRATPKLANDHRYIRLNDLLLRHGR